VLRRAAAEFLGTMLLVTAVVGSGIMGERLAAGNVALALLANTLATGAALVFLIFTFGPISGAHLNPVVSLAAAMQRELKLTELPAYLLAQVTGGTTGTVLAHLMFTLPPLALSTHTRATPGELLAEMVAAGGLVFVILSCARTAQSHVPFIVAAYIMSAYWFTSSTSFANPAVTIARSLSDTFAGIRPADVPGFVTAQFLGAFLATYLFRWFAKSPASS